MKLFKYTVALSTVLVLFTACIKKDAPELGDRGSSFIKILEAPVNVLYFSPFTNIDTVDLFSLRRDEVSSAKLNQSITVGLLADPDAVTAYNTANGTSFEMLPDSLFTIVTSGITKNGTTYSVKYNAGEMGKELTIGLDGSKWDVTHNYAIAFAIVDSAGRRIASSQGSIVVTLASKNKYDGVYALTIKTVGWGAYGISDGLSGLYPGDFELITAGVSSVSFSNSTSATRQPAFTTDNASPTAFGATSPLITFDPATDKIISVENTTPDDGRGRAFHLNPDVTDSRYDPSTKTIYAAYIMTQNGRPNQYIYDTLVYQKSR